METTETKHKIVDSEQGFQAIKAHTERVRGIGDKMTPIPVPEWGFTIYTNPPTVDEEDSILHAIRQWGKKKQAKTAEAVSLQYTEILITIIVRAKNFDGSRIFQLGQLELLRGFAMAAVARRVAQTIIACDLAPEELAKN